MSADLVAGLAVVAGAAAADLLVDDDAAAAVAGSAPLDDVDFLDFESVDEVDVFEVESAVDFADVDSLDDVDFLFPYQSLTPPCAAQAPRFDAAVV
jgi:hypothetical protein